MSSTALTTPGGMAGEAVSKTPDTHAIPPSAPTPPPGSWRHPKLDEIARRQSASIFSQSNLRRAIMSIIFLAMTFYIPSLLPTWAKFVTTQTLLHWSSCLRISQISLSERTRTLHVLLHASPPRLPPFQPLLHTFSTLGTQRRTRRHSFDSLTT